MSGGLGVLRDGRTSTTMVDIVTIGDATLYCGDCRDVLPTLPAVDCVITDPPYFKVKGDYWDNEWDKPAEFLAWMRGVLGLLADRMKPNGSAYVFASPQMAGRVETVAWERLNVLGHIVWRKGKPDRKAVSSVAKYGPENFRSFVGVSERVIFAEHYGIASLPATMHSARQAANKSRAEVAHQLGCDSRLIDKWETQRGERDSCEPTKAQFEAAMRFYGAKVQYDDAARPFTVTGRDQWSDVWDFEPVAPYPGKHPCEKPIPLLAHMLNASTKPGALVLDAFMGSGATGDACARLGRRFIGIERDREHFDSACRRLGQQHAQVGLFA